MSSAQPTQEELTQFRSPSNVTWSVGFGIAVPVLAVALRLLARHWRKVGLGADDYFIIFGAAFSMIDAGLDIWVIQNGMGHHVEAEQPQQLSNILKAFYISEQFYGAAITCIKLSVLCLYRRIFAVQKFRLWVHIVMALVVIWLLVNNFMTAFQCRPIVGTWQPLLKPTCLKSINLTLGLQVPNVILDIVILALPLTAISRLQLPKARKVSVGAVFAIGGLSIIFAIVRLAIIVSEATGPLSDDVTWLNAKLIWANVELMVGVFAACAPCYAPLLRVREDFRGLVMSLRYFVSSSRQRRSDRLPDEQDGDLELRPSPTEDTPPKNGVSATAAGRASTWNRESDAPLQDRIMVRKDLSAEAEHSNGKEHTGRREGWEQA